MELTMEPQLDPEMTFGNKFVSSSVEKTPIPTSPKVPPPLIVIAVRP